MIGFEKELVISMADGQMENMPEGVLSGSGLSFLTEYARKNHLSLAMFSMLKRTISDKESEAILSKLVDTEQNRLNQLLSIACNTQKSFDHEKYRAVLMKFFFSFPFVDDDLDFVLINKELKDGFGLLDRLGYKRIRNRSHIREPLKRLFHCHDGLYIHLHSEFSWNGVVYIDSENVWKRRVSKNINGVNVNIPSADDDLLITAAHAVFENKCIYLSDFLNAVDLFRSRKIDLDYIVRQADKYNWKRGLLVFLSHINFLYRLFYGQNLVSLKLPEPDFKMAAGQVVFPFIMKGTFSCSFNKLFLDTIRLRVAKLFREVVSYTVVDYLLYQRAKKAKKRLEAQHARCL